MAVSNKIELVRAWMRENGVQALIVPTDDPHGSEYLAEHWKCRQWLTGFTGSSGDAVVTMDASLLWTDSRYWLQAEEQLQLNGGVFTLMRDGVDISIEEWLAKRGLANTLESPRRVVRSFEEPFGQIWENRPRLPHSMAWIMPEELAGKSAALKIGQLVKWLVQEGKTSVLISDLAEVAWMLNMRGSDIEYNPFIICFFEVNVDGRHKLYVEASQVQYIITYLSNLGIEVLPYASAPSAQCVHTPIGVWKASKNPIEQDGFRQAHIYDGVAMVNFLSGLADDLPLREIAVDEKLTALRRLQPGFIGLSFETIAGYAAHGAIVHYEATPETDVEIGADGLLLIDSGAHYCSMDKNVWLGAGTTDVTRTVAMGNPDEEECLVYTLVLKGHLQLQNAVFPRGTTGLQLDVLARNAMWRAGYDYGHGTGHGVGHVLGVHEGPAQIRKNFRPDTVMPIAEGCVITDEPGIYVPGRFGVRIENTLLCVADRRTEFGDFLRFEPLTMCPYDRRLIRKDLLTVDELRWLNAYHRRVRETIMPLLDDEKVKVWLANATSEI